MNSKLVNTLLLSLAFVAMVIGIHRSIAESDIGGNYWIFMIGIMLYLVYNHRKRKSA